MKVAAVNKLRGGLYGLPIGSLIGWLIGGLLIGGLLAGCGVVPSQAEYDRVSEGKELAVPPQLDEPSRRSSPIPQVPGEPGLVDERPDPLEEEDEPG